MASLSGKSSDLHVQQFQAHRESEVDAEEARLEAELQQLFTITAGLPPLYTAHATLLKPVALPTTSASIGSPFARAWAPELQDYGVTQEKWLEVLDALSYAMISSTPLRVLGKAGKVLRVVPFGPFMLTGMYNSANTQIGQRVLRKTSTDKYLKRVNEEYFRVRGLRACLMKDEALRVFCRERDQVSTGPKIMAKVGRAAETLFTTIRLPIVTPIASAVLDAVKPLPPASSSSSTGPAQITAERRVAALRPHIAAVSFDVPPSTIPSDFLEQAYLRAALLNGRTRQTQDRSEQALGSIARREMTAYDYALSSQPDSSVNSSRRACKYQREAIRKAYAAERRICRGKNTGNVERRSNMDERRTLNRERDLLWLVVYPIERDADIAGGGREMDSDSPLQMSEGEYREELEAYEDGQGAQVTMHGTPPPYHAV